MKQLLLALSLFVSFFGVSPAEEWTPVSGKGYEGPSLDVDLRSKVRNRDKIVATVLAEYPTHRATSGNYYLSVKAAIQRTPEPFEGIWAQTKKECLDLEGPNSRTIIDLGNKIDGKPAPIIDRYENHCLIERNVSKGASTTIGATCYEFWEDLAAKRDAHAATIKLSMPRKDRLKIEDKTYLQIEDKIYLRCER
jgi:hypothetical protein